MRTTAESSLKLHIRRAYLQVKDVTVYQNINDVFLDQSHYGYKEQTGWIPQIVTEQLPEDFPHPCRPVVPKLFNMTPPLFIFTKSSPPHILYITLV